jgi:serine phosphatase RsbU (regulator of sigma subunit)/anti-sigma regulatory factor (Ser/Thr protein kinase)
MSDPLRILVADDNHVDRLLLSSIVRKEGYEVTEAVDGPDALEKFRSWRPQMVLLDALMPGLDGFEVAHFIKDEAGEDFVPIIFLTSLTEADALARALEVGGDDFLSKPYNQIILKAKLAAMERMRSMHVTMQRQRDEIGRHHAHLLQEQAAAKAVFDNVARTGNLDEHFIRYLISPLAVFNGDVLLAARNPAGDLHLLVGDFTGHGLTAAVGAMPLSEIFYGMTEKGFTVTEILREANRKLAAILPKGYFCCATVVALSFYNGTVEFWNGGLPPGCLVRPGAGGLVPLESRHLPLGILGEQRFDASTEIMEISCGDRLVMCTDGIVEARNGAGEAFGFERFDRILQETQSAASTFERLKDDVYAHIGGTGRDDDITLVEVTMVAPDEALRPAPAPTPEELGGAEQWQLCYELGPASLRSGNPLPLLQQVLVESPQLRRQAGAIYTVLAELYSNALEHGLLGLDSRLKRSPQGFREYYQARERALTDLDGWMRFEFRCEIAGTCGELRVTVTDSGPGFDYQRQCALDAADERSYHGRGVPLLRKLCRSLTYRGRGNEVEAVFAWSDDDVRTPG